MKFSQNPSYLSVEPKLEMEFGKFGGMYVPDPFSPALEALAEKVEKTFASEEFLKNREAVLEALGTEVPALEEVGEIKNASVYKLCAPVFELILSGYLALAKTLELTPSFAGLNAARLDTFVKAAAALDLKAYIALSKELSQDAALVAKLEKAGHKVENTKCVELFDDAILYAFQYFISNINNSMYVPDEANSGPYPLPSLTAAFMAGMTKVVKKAMDEVFKGELAAILASGFPGSGALAAFKACDNCDARLISVEPAFEIDRDDCYCGVYTKVVKVGEEERILCPELVSLWETSEVDRVYADDFTTALAAMDIKGKVLVVEDC